MSADLQRHIEEWSQRPFERGTSDCASFAAAWVAKKSGAKNPGGTYLGRRLTNVDARRMVSASGGLFAMVSSEMAKLGWQRVQKPEDGDVVLVADRTSLAGATVGVWNRGGIVSMHESGGVAVSSGRILGAWRWV